MARLTPDSSDDGKATDHHLVHLGSMTLRGWCNVMVEATGVVPEGRISPEDMGIWSDEHIAPLKRVVDYVHANTGKIGIQLAHAGRKASTISPWVQRVAIQDGWTGGEVEGKDHGGWPENVHGPSALAYASGETAVPIAASVEYIESIKEAYRQAVRRCKKAGFDFIEIHGAHGYWIHNFYSPISNKRTDQYGGSFENRIKVALEVAQVVREEWDGPLLFRISASDWLEELGPEKAYPGEKEEYAWWGIEQTTLLAAKLRDIGVDLLDVSSAGNDPRQKIDVKPGYQVHFAEHIKKNVPGLLIGAVGLINTPEQANHIVESGQADVALFGREVLRNIDFPLKAAEALGVSANPAGQYERAWTRMMAE